MIPSAAIAKTERLRLFLQRFEGGDEARRRFLPKNWEREDRVKEEKVREERSRKGVRKRGDAGLL